MGTKTIEGTELKAVLDQQLRDLEQCITISHEMGWQRTDRDRREQTARLKLIDALTEMIDALEEY